MSRYQSAALRLNNIIFASNIRCQLTNRVSTSTVLNYSPKQSIEEKLGIPPKPKKPLIPFMRYVVSNRSNVVQQNPQSSPTEVMKILSEQWKTVDDSTKEKLHDEYVKERSKYYEEMGKYEKLLSPDTKAEIAKAKVEIKNEKERKKEKKIKEQLGCPKKPGSSYVYFMRSKLAERGETPYKEFSKQISNEWSSLPQTQKSRFEQLYQEDMLAYRKKMDLWLEKMREQGMHFGKQPPTPKMAKPYDEPKKPGAPYNYFQKVKAAEHRNLSASELQKVVADEWERMSPEEKMKYEEMRKKDMEAYKQKMEIWSKKRESETKPGESLEALTSLASESQSSDICETNITKIKDIEPSAAHSVPPDQLKKTGPHNLRDLKFTSRQIIVTSILICTTLVIVFSVYLITFY